MKRAAFIFAALTAAALTVEARAGDTSITGRIVLVDPQGKPLEDRSNVVLYLEAAPELASPPRAPRPLEIRQHGKRFIPNLAVVVRGETVSFPNDDLIFHNVFSLSAAARFDLGLYKNGTTREVRFTKPGTIDVYCNIHPEMNAKIRVVDTPFFALTRTDGSYALRDVPQGSFMLVAWHVSGASAKQPITVSGANVEAPSFQLTASTTRTRHRRKDGSSYGRYP